jgi:hypothetical protein
LLHSISLLKNVLRDARAFPVLIESLEMLYPFVSNHGQMPSEFIAC